MSDMLGDDRLLSGKNSRSKLIFCFSLFSESTPLSGVLHG